MGRARKRFPAGPVGFAEIIFTLARSLKISAFSVPWDFPAAIAFRLQELGLAIEPVEGPFFPTREIKTEEEVRAIREGNRCSAAGLAAAEDLLRRATVRGGRLYHVGKNLTSERGREAIQIACLRQGGIATNTIVAGGDQGCDPHCEGNGPLRAGQLIIVDIFPRISRTGYFGDMTRTFIKGQPTDAQAKLVETVRSAQKLALSKVRAGVSGKGLRGSVVDHFTNAGFETKHGKEGSVGFFHGTGHGLGLEVHEAPRMGGTETRLRPGAVVTVEPGLYYPGLGGCRIEDVVQVTNARARMLSKFHYEWIL
jgi:Xaa-Pro aminopeptidase